MWKSEREGKVIGLQTLSGYIGRYFKIKQGIIDRYHTT